jgi:hypothetical protein
VRPHEAGTDVIIYEKCLPQHLAKKMRFLLKILQFYVKNDHSIIGFSRKTPSFFTENGENRDVERSTNKMSIFKLQT